MFLGFDQAAILLLTESTNKFEELANVLGPGMPTTAQELLLQADRNRLLIGHKPTEGDSNA